MAPLPTNGPRPARRADACNAPGDGVGRGNGRVRKGGQRDAGRGRALGRKAAHRPQVRGDSRTHRFHDPPPAGHGPQRHRPVTAEHDPGGELGTLADKGVEVPRGPFPVTFSDQQGGNDSHGLLSVIGPVAQAVSRRRDQLQVPEYPLGAVPLEAVG